MIVSQFATIYFPEIKAAVIEEWDGTLERVEISRLAPSWGPDNVWNYRLKYGNGKTFTARTDYVFLEVEARELVSPAWAAMRDHIDWVEYEQELLEEDYPF